MNRPRILFISTSPPEPGSGAGERSLSLVRALSTIAEVRVLLLRHNWSPAFDPASYDFVIDAIVPGSSSNSYYRRQRYGVGRFLFDPRLRAELDALHHREQFDYFFCRYFEAVMTGCTCLAPSIIDLDDVPSDVWKPRFPWEAMLSNWRLSVALKDFSTVFVTKETDLSKFRHSRKQVLPCISTTAHAVELKNTAPRLLFVGSKFHKPNYHGVSIFLDRIWPRVLTHVPNAILRLVGTGWSENKKIQGVEVAGFVSDLTQQYIESCAAICPIWIGSGACVKVAEAIAYGMPTVVTNFALDGYSGILRHEFEILSARDEIQFADHCVRILNDHSLRMRLSRAALAAAKTHLSQESIDLTIATAVDHLRDFGNNFIK